MNKIWLKSYQDEVPAEVNTQEYSSLVSLFEEASRLYARQVAYNNFGSDLSYAELDKKSYQLAVYLQSLGLQKGTRVAIMMPNLLQYPISIFGILRAGFVVVNTNPLYTAFELITQMNDSGAQVIIVLANFASTLEKALPEIPSLKHVLITEIGDVFPIIKRTFVNIFVKYIKKLVPSYKIPCAVSFNHALKIGKKQQLIFPQLTHKCIAFLQYTGGTTGTPKAAILTHGNIVSNVLQAYAWIRSLEFGTEDIVITALPLYHIFALTANGLLFLKTGSKNILITNPRDTKRFIKEIKAVGFTAFTGVNTLFNTLLNHPDFHKINFSKLKLSLSGGMALQKSLSLQWRKRTKTSILEAYGLTETSPAAIINPLYIKDYNGSIGLPLPSTEVSLRDDAGFEVAIGEIGEICIKGPQVMAGYWQRMDETQQVFTQDGFLKTGDLARFDEDGFVYLGDRKKDLIIISGFNVYPNEVEQVITMHPGVHEVGVIGVTKDGNEQVKACIVKADKKLQAKEIIEHCRNYLAAYKIPKIIVFCDSLPKSIVGKVLRRSLK